MIEDLDLSQFETGDVVLIVPPFCDVYQGHLACHLLQALARQEGFDVKVVYGNLLFAAMMGHDAYRNLLDERLSLEFVFQALAFGDRGPDVSGILAEAPGLARAAGMTARWADLMIEIVARMQPTIVGSACSFEQITSSIAILERCIDQIEGVTTIIGGANCEADMASGFVSTGTRIHHIFSGESEQTFISLLEDILVLDKTPDRILYGRPCHNMDRLPLPDYGEFFAQHDLFLGKDKRHIAGPVLPHETSRGCWWGEKHHCTFCGLNGGGMGFREKSAERAIAEITTLFQTYQVPRLNMTDNIMPHRYFNTVLPGLAEALPQTVEIFYEQKANISLDKAELLVAARVTDIQPGIEALDTDLLKCMNKGTTGAQNLRLLRYGRSLGMDISWNLLGEFPGDDPESYVRTLDLVRRIPHLQPPSCFAELRIDRFSPFHDAPERFGIRRLEPKPFYEQIFPEGTEYDKLAYYFDAEYDSGAHDCAAIVEELDTLVDAWNARWKTSERAILGFAHLVGERYVLIDTRDPEVGQRNEFVSFDQVSAALAPHRALDAELLEWLMRRALVFEMDGGLQALATAPIGILRRVETLSKAEADLSVLAQVPAQ